MKLAELVKLAGRRIEYDITLYDYRKCQFEFLKKYFTGDEILNDEKLSNMNVRYMTVHNDMIEVTVNKKGEKK